MRGSIKQRFLSRVNSTDLAQSSKCWIWQGATGSGSKTHRYGRFAYEGKPINAHRASWLIFHGEIPDGMFVCHKCDVTTCVNPSHLFLGSNAANLGDMAVKGRAYNGQAGKTHCPKGHAYSSENVYFSSAGKRHCKECRKYDPARDRERNRESMRKWRAKQREMSK